MRPPRWSAISESGFVWEREALDFLREHLPDHEPYRAWSNLEFIDDEGRVNEVDALVLTPAGLILVEIKSRPGTLQGDAHTWTWTTDGRQISDDNPLLLANRKAKRLASVLRRQDAFGRGKVRIPWVEAAIFLSGVRVEPRLDPGSEQKVFRRGDPRSASDRGIIAALTGTSGAELGRRGSVDSNVARATQRAVEQAGIRPRLRSRRVGDYELGAPLAEGGGWQDFLAKHVSLGVARRVRVYPFARAASPEERKRLGRMAAREFRVLEGIDHPGILRVLHFEESELGPALVFEHDPAAMRLDQFLAQHLKELTLEARLDLLRQLAVGLGYAHGKRLYHQGLTPQNVLVRDPTSARPRVQIMNWQVAARGEGNTSAVLMMTVGSRDLDEHFADPAKVYLAPESLRARTESGPRADVFSLGAVAYHLFTGKPPADNPLDLPEKLRAGDGLRLSEAIDGVGAGLEDLVRMSTAPNVAQRIGSAPEFLEYMALAEVDNRPEPPAPATVDPSVAQRDDRLDGGMLVERRLGRGSTADALLVRREEDGQRLVLKVAIDEIHGDRLRAEAELLASMHHHQNIVQFVDTITVSGRAGMLMEWAGEETLASLIRGPTPLSLDLVRRYGDELLQAVDYLEQQGVTHRDIKPDNIGIGAVGGTGRKRLVLFDFSLGRTPPENIQAGTQPYLDPFLSLRRPPRWDLHAERYAAAVTLNEMLTGAPPVWGDGLSDPAATEDEARIGAERFEPFIRDGLVAFFRRALSRAPEERFGNTEDMLRAWRQAFAPLDQRPIGQDDLEVIARQLDRRSPIAELGFSVEARDVLLRMHIHTVQQLLAVDRIRFRYLRNVGDKIRREIRLKAKHLAEYRPDLHADGEDIPVPGRASLDRLGELLLPRRPAGDETSEDRALANYLGIESASWPTPGDVAKACEIPRSVVATALEQARDRWHRARELNELRTDVLALVQGAGGVATVGELAGQLLAARGSVEEDEDDRDRLARAALRAAVELEASVEPIRFGANAEAEPVLLATHSDLADHARRLGQAADRLAASDPLPSPNRAQQELADVPASATVAPPPAQRLLRLAAAASRTAALSARLELYPRGMAPLAALRLSLGSLVGAKRLTEAEVRERVRGRFPDAAPLPKRPDLDALLEEAGAERNWRADQQGGAYYARDYATASSSSSLMRHGTLAPAVEATPEVLSARDLEEKLVHATKTGAFLALTVEPRRAARAEAELLRRFSRRRVSLERLLLQALREEAATGKAKWSVVLAADAAQPNTKDFKRLLSLAARAAVGVRRQALALAEPALLVNPGLLARYNLMPILTDLAQVSGARGGPPGLWLLVPQSDEGMPHIDGAALPVISSANWARLTDPWLANAHRAGARPAA
jgi:serine/threonine protein kinase